MEKNSIAREGTQKKGFVIAAPFKNLNLYLSSAGELGASWTCVMQSIMAFPSKDAAAAFIKDPAVKRVLSSKKVSIIPITQTVTIEPKQPPSRILKPVLVK